MSRRRNHRDWDEHDYPQFVIRPGFTGYKVIEIETGIIMRTLDTHDEAEQWILEASSA